MGRVYALRCREKSRKASETTYTPCHKDGITAAALRVQIWSQHPFYRSGKQRRVRCTAAIRIFRRVGIAFETLLN